MDHRDAPVEQIVRDFLAFDGRNWKHDPGMKTVEHACVHLLQFLGGAYLDFAPKKGPDQKGGVSAWNEYRPITEALVGRVFEWTVRLGYEAHASESVDSTVRSLADWMDDEFSRLRSKIPLGGITEGICYETFVARPKVGKLVHDAAHGAHIPQEVLREALKEYLPSLMGIGVVATRFLATCEHHGANDVNRDPEILARLWRRSGLRRLEGLERTMRTKAS